MIPGSVAIAYLHPGVVSSAFCMSLLALEIYETGRVGTPPIVYAERCSSGKLVDGRNHVARTFLDSDNEWLLFIDSDMGFAPDSVARLLEVAEPLDRPIVGGLCFAARRGVPDPETHAERFTCCPTMYRWVERDDEVGFVYAAEYPDDSLVKVDATGAAFLLVHRSVFESICDSYGDKWFDEVVHPTGPTKFSEDMSFCIRAIGCGCPVHVHTGVKTTHDKGGIFLDETTWRAQQERATVEQAA